MVRKTFGVHLQKYLLELQILLLRMLLVASSIDFLLQKVFLECHHRCKYTLLLVLGKCTIEQVDGGHQKSLEAEVKRLGFSVKQIKAQGREIAYIFHAIFAG